MGTNNIPTQPSPRPSPLSRQRILPASVFFFFVVTNFVAVSSFWQRCIAHHPLFGDPYLVATTSPRSMGPTEYTVPRQPPRVHYMFGSYLSLERMIYHFFAASTVGSHGGLFEICAGRWKGSRLCFANRAIRDPTVCVAKEDRSFIRSKDATRTPFPVFGPCPFCVPGGSSAPREPEPQASLAVLFKPSGRAPEGFRAKALKTQPNPILPFLLFLWFFSSLLLSSSVSFSSSNGTLFLPEFAQFGGICSVLE